MASSMNGTNAQQANTFHTLLTDHKSKLQGIYKAHMVGYINIAALAVL